jgi:hypothetical protein
MDFKEPAFYNKLKWSLPWLSRYPLWRANQALRRATGRSKTAHVVIVVANHFEPSWSPDKINLPWDAQMRRLDQWVKEARVTGRQARDADGRPFVHTYFYPGEQYYAPLLDQIAGMEAEGLGEVEIHLHHGLEKPDTPEELRRALVEFRDLLAEEHRCLSRLDGKGHPMYAFVHGNLALANSMGGQACGVDSEMEILAETGCYADLTLPAVPHQSQGPLINAIYQCGGPLNRRAAHYSGPRLRKGDKPRLPVMFTGPLVFNWRRRKYGMPFPRVDDGALTFNYLPEMARMRDWRETRIGIGGRPDWIFLKLYCHGFFSNDLDITIGETMRRFLGEMLDEAARSDEYRIHFATAREAFNMMMAAMDDQPGEPGLYRNYRLQQIRQPTVNPLTREAQRLTARRA